jgi:2-polyprenyl-3-methyl-5-hydroxy-6-metoxy-1,4-benzoquinol methylase
MEQQTQALKYFSTNADDWQRKSTQHTFSVIDNRHHAVLESIKAHPNPATFLDIGCGTGQLAIQVANMGLKSLGIDFAKEMIDKCTSNNIDAKAKAEFQCASIFDANIKENAFDIISAQGFIEYISLEQLDDFLSLVEKSLKQGGALALGSRNRLFNLHSLNEYTKIELALNNIDNMIQEALVIQNAENQESMINQLSNLQIQYRHPEKHPETGILVDTRFQFTPCELISKFKKHNLKPKRLFPVHYHGLPLQALKSNKFQELHNDMANLISSTYINDPMFVPYSSSFVIEAVKI